MNQRETRQYQRIRHYQGERLLAPDLQDEADGASNLRALHVVGLHDTWGIALGLGVHAGPRGSYIVAPGLAYDAFGREVMVGSESVIMGPEHYVPNPADGGWELWLRYRESGASSESFLCEPGQSELVWRKSDEGRLGREVPLAAVEVRRGRVSSLDLSNRYYVRPLSRPQIASGRTADTQRWSLWSIPAVEGPGRFLGLQTTVDTSGAGFVGTPRYMVTLQAAESLFVTSTGTTGPGAPAARQLNGHIAQSSASQFVYRLILPLTGRGPDIRDTISVTAASAPTTPIPQLSISWLGVEPRSGCEPAFNLMTLFLQLLPLDTFIPNVQFMAFDQGVNQ